MDQNVDWLNPDIRPNITKSHGSTNCPNCGAPIDSERCPYCGSVFLDFACMDADEPFFMKIKKGEEVHIMKVMLRGVDFHRDDPVMAYFDDRFCVAYNTANPTVSVDFVIVP